MPEQDAREEFDFTPPPKMMACTHCGVESEVPYYATGVICSDCVRKRTVTSSPEYQALTAERDAYKAALEHLVGSGADGCEICQDTESVARTTLKKFEGGNKDGKGKD